MNPAIEKTGSLLLLIAAGFLLRKSLPKAEHHTAFKVLILNIALPAVIFVALMKTHIALHLLLLPVIALGFSFTVLFLTQRVFPLLYGIPKNSAEMRTLALLMPSLAPGLSCFPFLKEYAGEEALALGALTDLGNKLFVLVIGYILAMNWFFRAQAGDRNSNGSRLRSLFMAMAREPVNIGIILAILLLLAGLHFQDLPVSLASSISMMSDLMTPLILLFIGVTVVFKWAQFRVIISILLLRSGITFCLSGLFMLLFPSLSASLMTLVIVFPQSAVSFWPLSHMSTVSALEKSAGGSGEATFSPQFALNVLALSLPFSSGIALLVFSTGQLFLHPLHLLYAGIALAASAIAPVLLHRFRSGVVSTGVKISLLPILLIGPYALPAQTKGMFIYELKNRDTALIKTPPQYAVYFTKDKSMEALYKEYEYQYDKMQDETGMHTTVYIKPAKPHFLLKDISAPSLILSTVVGRRSYLTTDTLHHFNWTIHKDTKNIQGYDCSKASTYFRGRNYTAWFTPDIPVPFGPWKFGGLPGLILDVYDDKGMFDYRVLKMDFAAKFDADTLFRVPDAYKDDQAIDHRAFMQMDKQFVARAKKLSGIEEIITPPNGVPGRSTQTITIGEIPELY